MQSGNKPAREAAVSMDAPSDIRTRTSEDALGRTSERLRRLVLAARQLGSTLDPREIYEALVRLLGESIPFDGLVVSSYDPVAQEIRCQYAWVEGERPDPASFPPLKLGPEGHGMQSRVIRTGLPYLFSDVEQRVKAPGTYYEVTPEGQSERMSKAPDNPEYTATRSAMMAPIILDGQVLGVVQVMCMRQGAYTNEDLELMEGMVLQMGAAARNAALYAKAQREVEERTKAQAAIEELNRRLQRAMAETHHRVKNNLQVLAALVDMQLLEGEGPISRSALHRLMLQIQSLSSLHDLLTTEAKARGEADVVSAHDALLKLITIIEGAAGDRRIRLAADDVEIPVRQCTAFALLTNELISNAVKHGAGDISIRISRKERMVAMEIDDDGPGFPRDFDPRASGSTGLELIESLSRWDLNGRVDFANRTGGGARVSVTFPLADA